MALDQDNLIIELYACPGDHKTRPYYKPLADGPSDIHANGDLVDDWLDYNLA